MPREHTGLGTLLVPGHPDTKVVLNIAQDDTGGWQTIRGTISGDPAVLLSAFDNDRSARLVHDSTGFLMHLTIADVQNEGIAHVTVVKAEHISD